MRTIISIIGIASVVMAFVFISAAAMAMNGLIDSMFESMRGKLIVVQKGKIDPVVSEIPEDYLDKVMQINHIQEATPIIWRFFDNGTKEKSQFLVVKGVEIQTITIFEDKFKIIEGKNLDGTESKEVIIGKELAERYNLKVGKKVIIKEKDYLVKGIFTTDGGYAEAEAWVPLEEAQKRFNMRGKLSTIAVVVDHRENIDQVRDTIQRQCPKSRVFLAETFAASTSSELEELQGVVLAVSLIALIAFVLGVSNTMTLTLRERMHDIGIMKSIGISNKSIFSIYLLEAEILSFLGGIFGIIFCYGLINYLGLNTAYIVTYALKLKITEDLAVGTLAYSLVIGFIGSLYPIFKTTRMSAVDILRRFG